MPLQTDRLRSVDVCDLTYEQIDCYDPLFHQVLQLRQLAYGRSEAGDQESFDCYSLHFVARADEEVVGALRVTCRTHGPVESEEFYPSWILAEFGHVMCAASRLCVRPDLTGTVIPHELTKLAWSVALGWGVRIDISKARLGAIPFYLRRGHFFVRDSVFDFGRWDAKCGLIAFPANAKHPTTLAKVFAGIADPCDLDASRNRSKFTLSYADFAAVKRLVGKKNHNHEGLSVNERIDTWKGCSPRSNTQNESSTGTSRCSPKMVG